MSNNCLPSGVLAAGLLLVVQLEVLATLQDVLDHVLALGALHLQGDLLRGLGLLVEDRLGLASVTLLLAVITTLSEGEHAGLAGLVLDQLELLMVLARSARAVHLPLLWEHDHLA
jgi:hypothetical protein